MMDHGPKDEQVAEFLQGAKGAATDEAAPYGQGVAVEVATDNAHPEVGAPTGRENVEQAPYTPVRPSTDQSEHALGKSPGPPGFVGLADRMEAPGTPVQDPYMQSVQTLRGPFQASLGEPTPVIFGDDRDGPDRACTADIYAPGNAEREAPSMAESRPTSYSVDKKRRKVHRREKPAVFRCQSRWWTTTRPTRSRLAQWLGLEAWSEDCGTCSPDPFLWRGCIAVDLFRL